MTAIDERVVMDVDLDARVPCTWTDCPQDPTHVAIMVCAAAATHELPLCAEHLAKTSYWYEKLEYLIVVGVDPELLPHQICLAHRALVRMRGSRPL